MSLRWLRRWFARGASPSPTPPTSWSAQRPIDLVGHSTPRLLKALRSPNGYEREAGLRALDEGNASALLPDAVPRLNDWVPEVAAVAWERIDPLVLPRLARAWLYQLPALDQLRRCGRVDLARLAKLRRSVESMLHAGWNAGMLAEGERAEDPDVRRAAWKLGLRRSPPDEGLREEAMQHDDPGVRTILFDLVREDAAWMLRFRGDPVASLRRQALYRIVDLTAPGYVASLRIGLLDRAPGIRSAAAYFLKKEGEEPAAVARAALDRGLDAGALLALGEHGNIAQDGERIEEARATRSPRVRAAALEALVRLDPQGALPVLIATLEAGAGRERKVALRFLRRAARELDAAVLERLGEASTPMLLDGALRLAPFLSAPAALALLLRCAPRVDRASVEPKLKGQLQRLSRLPRRLTPSEAQPIIDAIDPARGAVSAGLVEKVQEQLNR